MNDLIKAQSNGKYLWGAVNWELRSPYEKVRELKTELSLKLFELEAFEYRISNEGFD